MQWIEVGRIRPGALQPRRHLDPAELEELAQSIREHGVLQPLLVRAAGDGYELLAGERRWRAAQLAGLERVPALVYEADDRRALEVGLLENIQRADLHFFEEAEGYRRLIEEFGLTQEELARRLGRSQSAIANKLRLLRLSPEVRRIVAESGLGERQARALLRLEDPALQAEAARRMAQRGMSASDGERLVEQLLRGRPRRRVRGGYGDARIFVNGLRQVVRKARQAGFSVELEEQEDAQGWTFVVRLGRQGRPAERGR
ncbi:MAG TPA: ParB/RepB/Spo0J family partition protein [Limnochordales bacterium]